MRLNPELCAIIDGAVEHLSKEHRGFSVSRTDAVRALVIKGAEAFGISTEPMKAKPNKS